MTFERFYYMPIVKVAFPSSFAGKCRENIELPWKSKSYSNQQDDCAFSNCLFPGFMINEKKKQNSDYDKSRSEMQRKYRAAMEEQELQQSTGRLCIFQLFVSRIHD